MRKRCASLLAPILGLGCFVSPVQAMWKASYATSPDRAWYSAQFNKVGQWCCDKADGHAYYDDYQMLDDGSVKLSDEHLIPAYMVLHGNNPTGHAVWWYTTRLDGTKLDYCFAPGPLG